MLCALVESIILEPNAIDKSAEMENVRIFLTQSFIISYIWAIGGNLVDSSRQAFELFVKNQFYNNPHSRYYFCHTLIIFNYQFPFYLFIPSTPLRSFYIFFSITNYLFLIITVNYTEKKATII